MEMTRRGLILGAPALIATTSLMGIPRNPARLISPRTLTLHWMWYDHGSDDIRVMALDDRRQSYELTVGMGIAVNLQPGDRFKLVT